MQSIPVSDHSITDLREAYRMINDMVARLKKVFDMIDDEAILGGKAIPLVRLLHSVLRTQIQLAGKIESYQKAAVKGREAVERCANNGKSEFDNSIELGKPIQNHSKSQMRALGVSSSLPTTMPPSSEQLAFLMNGNQKPHPSPHLISRPNSGLLIR